ncbi:MAG TPA: choice-of-anchor R domain-containing protein [Fimbriimonas sp.]|nr:choice-of-anchor R domain-containing protein [Fimbriimonas sp.]
MKKLNFGPGYASVLTVGFLAVSANAQVVISNFPGNDGIASQFLDPLRLKGMAFVVDGSSDYVITSATLRFEVLSTDVAPNLTIRKDNGSGAPGAIVGTFTNPSSYTVGHGSYTFTSSIPVAAAGTYWLTLGGDTGTGPFHWNGSSPAQTPTGTWTHAGQLFTQDGGTNWAGSGVMNTYELTATPSSVPEPASMAVLGAGALILLRRRNRR